jgi:cyclophilin family peptidyl-prolyl cis-trans isomerase
MQKKTDVSFISLFVRHLTVLALLFSPLTNANEAAGFKSTLAADKTYALIDTTMGQIELELYASRTPKTVENFIRYAESGFYKDTLFHRVIPNFMVQGGGFDTNFVQKATQKPVRNEANAFIPNLRGTISMARTNDPDSATSQFFINVVDNASLNKTATNPGYAVFGKVIHGMNVADQMSKVKTKREGYMSDIPVEPVIIKNIVIKHPAVKASE